MTSFVIDGEPISKARPRVTSKGTYTPLKTLLAEQAVGWLYRQAGGRGPDPVKHYGIWVTFYCGNKRRRDLDNMVKLILGSPVWPGPTMTRSPRSWRARSSARDTPAPRCASTKPMCARLVSLTRRCPMAQSPLRVAQAERRWIAEDMARHTVTCWPCSQKGRPKCPTGRALQDHLDRAARQIELLKEPAADQLELGLLGD